MQIICKIINSVSCPRHLTIAGKLLRIKTYLGGVVRVFHGILTLFHIYEQRTGFLSREPDFQEFLKKPQTCLVGVFWVFQRIFSIVRHLRRETDVWAENRIFTNFLKASKHVLEIQNMVQCCSVNNAFVNPTYFLWSPTCKQFVAFTFTFLQLPFNFQADLIASALYDLHQFFRMISQLPSVCILVSCSSSRTILVSSDKYITILLSFLLNPKLLVNILAAHMMLATIFTLLTYIVFS